MLLAEDLLLLLTNDDTGKLVVGSIETDIGLAGAVLIELTLAGRVDVDQPGRSGRLVVNDSSPLGDPVLDHSLARLGAVVGRKPDRGIVKVERDLRDRLYARLAQRGILRLDEGKVLGLFPTRRWPAVDFAHEQRIRTELHDAMVVGVEPTAEIGALAALLHAVRAVDKVMWIDHAERKAAKARAKQLAEGAWAAGSVRSAIDAVNAATMAAVTAAVAAGSVAGSGG